MRRRFRLDDDDLARVQDWVAASGIRWGLDAAHRAPFKLATLPAGTWRAGLDRILLGVTMTEDGARLFAGVLPLDDVDSGAIDLAGRLAELVDRLQASLDALDGAQADRRLGGRDRRRRRRADRDAPRDAWQRAELQRLLDDVVKGATAGETVNATPLALGEVRALLADRLQGRPDPRELPHRPPDHLHAGADAVGAAPRRLPARARRRRVPPQGAARRRRPDARRPARRRAGPAHRGPPAAARRAARARPTG